MRKPEQFTKLYTLTQDKARKRHLIIPTQAVQKIKDYAQKHKLHLSKNVEQKIRIKAGTTKNNEFKSQSLLTPTYKALPEIMLFKPRGEHLDFIGYFTPKAAQTYKYKHPLMEGKYKERWL